MSHGGSPPALGRHRLNDRLIVGRRAQLKQASNIFRLLAKTLHQAGIITERTRPIYANWLDVDQVVAQPDFLDLIGEVVAQQGIAYLQEINRQRTSKVRKKSTT